MAIQEVLQALAVVGILIVVGCFIFKSLICSYFSVGVVVLATVIDIIYSYFVSKNKKQMIITFL